MNELEILEKTNDIEQQKVYYNVPAVSFPGYEEFKDKAQTVAAYISSMEVTEDSIKATKETLARARKLTDGLNRARIDVKKDLLSSYTVFEAQVKEIVGIVDEADKALRGKVRELEEAEREAKREALKAIWDKRIAQIPIIETAMPDAFERWLLPRHLNKSASMKSVETDMAGWIDATYKDMNTALSMGKEYLAEYGRTGDLAQAIGSVNALKARETAVDELVKEEEPEEVRATFTVIGAKDIKLAKMLFEENDIEFIIC